MRSVFAIKSCSMECDHCVWAIILYMCNSTKTQAVNLDDLRGARVQSLSERSSTARATGLGVAPIWVQMPSSENPVTSPWTGFSGVLDI